jgi:hypothetical protein
VLAVGGDTAVARLMGIRVERTLVKTYVVTALFAALAGLFLVARTRTGDPLIGSRFALDSLAAVVVGGTVLGGGRFTLAGTVLGALALGLLFNVLNLIGVPTFYQTAPKGIVLIARHPVAEPRRPGRHRIPPSNRGRRLWRARARLACVMPSGTVLATNGRGRPRAVAVGFEPTVELPPHTLSRRAP